MVNQNVKLFYLSGLFSISFFIILLFSALYYAYTRDKILKIKTKKNDAIEITFYEAPPPQKQEIKVKKETPKKPKPKPKILSPKPKQPPHQEPKESDIKQAQKEEVTPPPPPPPPPPKQEVKSAPSLDSLFSKIDTSKFQPKEEEEEEKPIVSEETIKRLKEKAKEIKTPIDIKKDNNFSIDDYKLQREFKISNTKPISLDYKELEITSSSLENPDSGVYDEVFSKIQNFLHLNWQPSPNMAGNSAYVRIILSDEGIIQHFKIVTAGKNPEFNIELQDYLQSIIGQKVPVELQEAISFEVKFRAKE